MAHINTSSKQYEFIVFEHNALRNIFKKALKIVRDFIIKNKLILTGGMAIDLALRNRGKKLYDDRTLPDYDFYSSDHANHAYNLCEILHKAGLPDVDAIYAMHPTTIRVRVKFTPVADITYIPNSVYKKILTIKNAGLIHEHPHYKFISQHLSLCRPYSMEPFETVHTRWKKDYSRWVMIYDEYPILPDKPQTPKTIKHKIPTGACITGLHAIGYWAKHAGITGIETKINKDLELTIPSNTPDPLSRLYYLTLKSNKKPTHNQLLDYLPPSTESDSTVEYHLSDDAISAHEHKSIHIVNIQHCMAWLLCRKIFYKDKLTDYFYDICIEILKIGIKTHDRLLLPSTTVYGFGKTQTHTNKIQKAVYEWYSDIKRDVNPLSSLPDKWKPNSTQEKINYSDWIYQIDGSL